MPDISVYLPDGSAKAVPEGSTVLGVAEAIGPRLAQAAIAGKVGGDLVDVNTTVADGDAVEIITNKSPEALHILRHSAAHVMAEAVKDLYPMVQFGIGPAIEDGFYYDFGDGAPVHAGRPRGDRGSHGADHRRGAALQAHRDRQARGVGRVRAAGPQAGAHRRAPRVRDDLDLPPGRVHRPLPWPARARHRPYRRLQAHQDRRRVLARRQRTPHAPAHLRHRLVHAEGPRRVSRPSRRGREARPPQARQGARPLQLPRGGRRRSAALPPQGRARAAPPAGVAARRALRARLRRGHHARTSTRPTSGRSPATTRTTARTCTSSRSTRATARSASTASSR